MGAVAYWMVSVQVVPGTSYIRGHHSRIFGVPCCIMTFLGKTSLHLNGSGVSFFRRTFWIL